jgi:hypothetical protein
VGGSAVLGAAALRYVLFMARWAGNMKLDSRDYLKLGAVVGVAFDGARGGRAPHERAARGRGAGALRDRERAVVSRRIHRALLAALALSAATLSAARSGAETPPLAGYHGVFYLRNK